MFLGQNVSFKVENIILDILQKFTSQTNVMREPKRDKSSQTHQLNLDDNPLYFVSLFCLLGFARR